MQLRCAVGASDGGCGEAVSCEECGHGVAKLLVELDAVVDDEYGMEATASCIFLRVARSKEENM